MLNKNSFQLSRTIIATLPARKMKLLMAASSVSAATRCTSLMSLFRRETISPSLVRV